MIFLTEREKDIFRQEFAEKYGQRFDDINADPEDEDLSDCEYNTKETRDLFGRKREYIKGKDFLGQIMDDGY